MEQSSKKKLLINKPNEKMDSKYDMTYDREIWASFIGIILLIVTHVNKVDNYDPFNDEHSKVLSANIIARIISSVFVFFIAKRQNRSYIVWSFIALFAPAISLIIIGFLKKLRLERKETDSQNEKISL